MIKKAALFILFLSLGIVGKAQFMQYYSVSFYGQVSALSNYKYLPYQNRAFYGGGIDFGTSITQYINTKVGLNYISTYINNGKEPHSICDQPDNSCFSESEVTYINTPISIELYENGGRSQTKTSYLFTLHPMFSMIERHIKSEIYQEPEVELRIDTTLNANFKFQDLHIGFSLATDIAVSRKFKIYFEPSIQHSLLFRKEDLINPNYIISLKVGCKIRSYRR